MTHIETLNPQYGIYADNRDLLDGAVAYYGLRGVLDNPYANRYGVSPTCVDLLGATEEIKETWKKMLNTHIISAANFNYRIKAEEGEIEPFSDLVTLLDWGRYKAFARRQTGYVNVCFLWYQKPFDMKQAFDDLRRQNVVTRLDQLRVTDNFNKSAFTGNNRSHYDFY